MKIVGITCKASALQPNCGGDDNGRNWSDSIPEDKQNDIVEVMRIATGCLATVDVPDLLLKMQK